MGISKSGKNFASLILSNFGVQGLRFLTIAILARRLGAEIFGAYNYILLLLSYGFIVVEFGLRTYGIREFAQGRGTRELIAKIFKIRICLSIFSVAIITVLSLQALRSSDYKIPALIMACSLFADALLLDFVAVAQENLVGLSVANIAQALFLFIYATVFIHGPQDLSKIAFAFLASHGIWALVTYLSTGKIKKGHDSELVPHLKAVIYGGMPFLVANFVSTIQFSMDLLLLGQFHYSAWLGDYGAALKILGIPLGIVHAFTGTMQPRLAREAADLTSPALRNTVSAGTRMVWFIVGPVFLMCLMAGHSLINLFFGAQFQMAGSLLIPLSLAMTFFCLGQMPSQALFVSGKTKLLLVVVFMSFILTLVVLLGPLATNHPEAVPWIMAIAMAANMLLLWRLFGWRHIITDEEVKYLFPGLALLSIFVFAARALELKDIFVVGAGVIGYFGGLSLMKIWTTFGFKETLGKSTAI